MLKIYLRFPPCGLAGVRQYQVLSAVAYMKNVGEEVREILLHLGLLLQL